MISSDSWDMLDSELVLITLTLMIYMALRFVRKSWKRAMAVQPETKEEGAWEYYSGQSGVGEVITMEEQESIEDSENLVDRPIKTAKTNYNSKYAKKRA